eukprot:TRINITY_DN13368_c0_g1_i1.p1 TRINITY_DN13368_c0_g1~~TRINITY_DN13368_c0_g1_i1.p1  ORF type:complete len:301 (+),score=55.17 TRINITY_DN13368_c0_g1_i1:104-1006(+)
MATYFDMPPGYTDPDWYRGRTYSDWSSDTDGYSWDEYVEDGQDDWFGWKATQQQHWNMDMKAQPSYGQFGHHIDHTWHALDQAQDQAQRAQQDQGSRWETSAAMLGSLPSEPKEILVVNSTSSGSYESLCRDAKTADVVAFDAEWVPDFKYGSDNPISVLQLAFPASRRVYVLQLGRLGKRLPQEVQLMLVNPDVLKVGFAVNHKDAQKLMRTGIAVTQGSVVDVQLRSAESLGIAWGKEQSLSLRRAASELLGCELLKDKRCACSDWSCEQLTPEQVHYAALDAWVALRLYYLFQYPGS